MRGLPQGPNRQWVWDLSVEPSRSSPVGVTRALTGFRRVSTFLIEVYRVIGLFSYLVPLFYLLQFRLLLSSTPYIFVLSDTLLSSRVLPYPGEETARQRVQVWWLKCGWMSVLFILVW